jgi:hypothetical protein
MHDAQPRNRMTVVLLFQVNSAPQTSANAFGVRPGIDTTIREAGGANTDFQVGKKLGRAMLPGPIFWDGKSLT